MKESRYIWQDNTDEYRYKIVKTDKGILESVLIDIDTKEKLAYIYLIEPSSIYSHDERAHYQAWTNPLSIKSTNLYTGGTNKYIGKENLLSVEDAKRYVVEELNINLEEYKSEYKVVFFVFTEGGEFENVTLSIKEDVFRNPRYISKGEFVKVYKSALEARKVYLEKNYGVLLRGRSTKPVIFYYDGNMWEQTDAKFMKKCNVQEL